MTTIVTLTASIVAAVAAVVGMTITVWNTAPVSAWRHRRLREGRERRERRKQEQWIESMKTNPVLLELEARFDELVAARDAGEASSDLRQLWAKAFDLTVATPVPQPLGFGGLLILNREDALSVSRGTASVLQWRHFDPLRPAIVMASTVGLSYSPATIIK